MKKIVTRIPALVLSIMLLNTSATFATDVAAGGAGDRGTASPSSPRLDVRLARTFTDEAFEEIATAARTNISTAKREIGLLETSGASGTPARSALDTAFPGIVSDTGSIIGVVDETRAVEFLRLKRAADLESAMAKAGHARLANLADRIATEERTAAFCDRAPRVLKVVDGLVHTMLPKEVVYKAAFDAPGTGMQPSGYGYAYHQPRFGRDKTRDQLGDESLANFTVGVRLGQLYLDLSGLERFLKAASPISNLAYVREQLTGIVGTDAAAVQAQVNDFLAAFPTFVNDAKLAVSAAENAQRAADVRLASLMARKPVDIAGLETGTSESETYARIKTEEGRKASAFATVQKWLDELAEHLRKNGFVS